MRRVTWPVAALLAVPAAPLPAQNPEDEVLVVVRQLFDGMRAADGAAVRAVFHPGARLGGLTREGEVRFDGIDGFVSAVDVSEGKWDERIWDPEVRIDDYLATAWTPYAFYFDGELSHCGVNSFQLLRTGEGWKVVGLVDSRRREGCQPPAGAR